MARSYKKYPVVRQEKEDYRYLNRQIRHDKFAEFPTPGAFKRHRPHWYSWHYRWTREEAIEKWHRSSACLRFPTLDEWLEYWARCTVRKQRLALLQVYGVMVNILASKSRDLGSNPSGPV